LQESDAPFWFPEYWQQAGLFCHWYSRVRGLLAQLSRNAAKNTYTLDDFVQQTAGIECRKDPELIDEIPAAYKPIDQVMANQVDLVEVLATLRQLICVKG
jgi:RNA-splicing ligase RtcB